ncbi:MAG: type VI secretion system membrane subunit TssM [Polyangiales bacterium]
MLGIILAGLFCAGLWAVVILLDLAWTIAAVGTLAVVLFFGVRFAYRRIRAARASRKIERALAKEADSFASRARPDQQPEIAALKSEFDRAVASIKSSKLGKGGAGALYALPWYVIIGPPGAGKSTAIRNSGLNFPYQSARGAVRGVGGTRNCDWWLANEAVILDTAGRYATDDDDREEWQSFLDMLKQNRPRRPVNGILIAVSVEVLIAGQTDEIEATAEKLRARLDEVMGRLGLVLPVYLLFTKCDLLPGFVETFSDLRRSERGQVWGFTLPASTRGESLQTRIEHDFGRLEQVLERRVIARLAETRQVAQRERIYGLPEELGALREPLCLLAERLFAENVYQDAPIVRGVYFTSGTQEGTVVGRAMSAMAAAYGLSAERGATEERGEPKSYFLGELFSQVIFPDAHIAGESMGALKRQRLVELCVAAGLSLLAAGFVAIPAFAYANNSRLLREVEDAMRKVASAGDAPTEMLPLEALDPLRGVVATLGEHEDHGVPARYGMGFYQGDRVVSKVQAFYTATVRERLLAPFVLQSAARLDALVASQASLTQRPSVEQHAQAFELLKGYLLLTKPRAASQPPLDASTRAFLLEHVEVRLRGDAKAAPSRAALRTNLEAYLDLLAKNPELALPRQQDVVDRARTFVSRIPPPQLAIDRLVALVEGLGIPDLTIAPMVGAGVPITGSAQVKGAFTRKAWDERLRALLDEPPPELLGEAWVLGDAPRAEADDDALRSEQRCALRAEYFGRYIGAWRQFVGGLRIEEPRDKERALVVLRALTLGSPPPLESLLRQVAYNAALEEPTSRAMQAVESAGVVDKLMKKLQGTGAERLLPQDACAKKSLLTAASVKKELRGFYGFGVSEEAAAGQGAAAPQTGVQIYQEQLLFIHDAMQAYATNPESSEALLVKLQTANGTLKSLTDRQELGWRPRFDALLWPPINGASLASSSDLAGQKSMQWCTAVVLPFERGLRGRYPFSKSGQDAALNDVAEFYRPGTGILWAAYEGMLARDVTRAGDRYEMKMGSAVASMYSGQLTEFLNRSQAIATSLFPSGGDKPTVAFEVRVRPSPGVAQILLTIDGQTVDFHNGPERWVPVRWPGDGKMRGVHVRIKGAGIDETVTQDGDWGLVRLLDSGTVSAVPNQRYFSVKLRLRTQNDITFDVMPARAENPLVGRTGKALEPFRAAGVDAPRGIAGGKRACGPEAR